MGETVRLSEGETIRVSEEAEEMKEAAKRFREGDGERKRRAREAFSDDE